MVVVATNNKGFNVGYQGTDPYVSYETSWGKERFIKEDYIRYFKYYVPYVENTSSLVTSSIKLQNLPKPYCSVPNLLPYNAEGAYFNSEYIKKLFDHNNITKVIEIGSDYGLSTRHIASLLPKDGILYAIDVWGPAYHPNTYGQFLSNAIRFGLTKTIVPIRARSDQAIRQIASYGISFDMIYVDGDHETIPVFKDLELYFPLLSEHGIMCGDDWLLATVRAAVLLFAYRHQLTVYGDCNFWFLKKEDGFKVCSFLEASDEIWNF